MVASTPAELERPMLRMGSVALIAGVVIFMVSTIVFHASSRDPMDNPVVFAVYAESDPWIAAHIGQFAGIMLVFAGGFVAIFRLLVHSGSSTASALSWFGLVAAIITASTYAILQAVDGIALKIAVDSWYAISPSSTAGSEEEKAIAFRVAEGIRWMEIGINSYFRMLQGAVGIIFGVAIAKSALLSRWIGAVGIAVGAVSIAAGVITAYIGFSEPVSNIWAVTLYLWIIILGIFMWRKTRAKKMVSR
ncbi:MAG TPA: DUF4386 family protein [Nitrososphaeraceae archaeon]|nr:DUF4386 family protein [Nitrososphaeraceae archaeon]